MPDVIVIGGGAAGMMAAYSASLAGHSVFLLEQNEKLGKKIYITGKGRCNFTNAAPIDELMQAVYTNPKFLYSAFYSFSNEAVMDFFEKEGMPYKIERGNRAFPVSDHSSDVIKTLESTLKKSGVTIRLYSKVAKILQKDGCVFGVLLASGEKILAKAVIVATGGLSYPTTGSTGDGYRFAKSVGHHVTDTHPALVPLVTKETYIPQLQGLSLRNVSLSIYRGSKKIYEEFGEMLFTHFGISGPLVLSASSLVTSCFPDELIATIDLKPALSDKQLDDRLLREFSDHANQQLKSIYSHLLPSKMIPVMLSLVGIDDTKLANAITKEERARMVHYLKSFPMTLVGTRDYKEAIITKGGVDVREIDPATMQSKKVNGLFFAGEVLDLDAKTGGFNLQIAWSTGFLAGCSVDCV